MLKEDQENAINGKQKVSVREEIVAVSSTTEISVQNRHRNPLLPLNHRQKRMVEILRKERVSEAGDNIKGKCTRSSCDFWNPPECQFYKKKKNRDANSVISV